jgi:K+-sensing histidine kinase KdpD
MSHRMSEKPLDKVIKLSDSFNKERELIHRQMMSSVSHDLKTPLASIIGSLEIHDQMKAQLKPEKMQVLLDTALQEAYRLDNFISNILDMAKLETHQVKVKGELCDIGRLLEDCITQLAPHLKDSRLEIHSISGIITATIDPMLLQRAIGLLVDNSVKYGGTPSVITIEYGRGDFAQYFIRVRDHGPGVSASEREAIFCKYTRFAKQDMQNAGTGLGLAICREIMCLLEGSVSVGNHPEGGAVFTLQFPVG